MVLLKPKYRQRGALFFLVFLLFVSVEVKPMSLFEEVVQYTAKAATLEAPSDDEVAQGFVYLERMMQKASVLQGHPEAVGILMDLVRVQMPSDNSGYVFEVISPLYKSRTEALLSEVIRWRIEEVSAFFWGMAYNYRQAACGNG